MNDTTHNDDADDLITCPTCDGSGVMEHGDHDDACPTCLGDGAIEPGSEVCEPAEGDTPHGICDDDGEPPELDSDVGFDPYTGGAEDDGYDDGRFDDGGCDSDF
jgi:RecJ-like exonuclease